MRRMMALIFFLSGAWAANAQAIPNAPDMIIPRFDVGAGYQFIRSNAPPGGCECFTLQGGYATMSYHFSPRLGLEAQFIGAQATNISSTLGQDLTLMTYTIGPSIRYPLGRILIRGEAEVGGAHGGNSYFPSSSGSTSSANSFAFLAGGGADLIVNRRIDVRVIQAQYLHTGFPNGGNDSQSHLALGAGIVFKFGWAKERILPEPRVVVIRTPPPPPIHEMAYACSAGSSDIIEGNSVFVNGNASGSQGNLSYEWSTTAGRVVGSGHNIQIDTTGVPPGEYRVKGKASSEDHSADCTAVFRVVAKPAPPEPNDAADRAFHDHVPDVLFDYDKSDIRPEGEDAIQTGIKYLQANPKEKVLIGGYADERGTQQYNIGLGLKRANNVRDRMIAAGISPDRVQVVSYGKYVQVCTKTSEECFQLNRRAAMMRLP